MMIHEYISFAFSVGHRGCWSILEKYSQISQIRVSKFRQLTIKQIEMHDRCVLSHLTFWGKEQLLLAIKRLLVDFGKLRGVNYFHLANIFFIILFRRYGNI